jgi:hypothetical protein
MHMYPYLKQNELLVTLTAIHHEFPQFLQVNSRTVPTLFHILSYLLLSSEIIQPELLAGVTELQTVK